ncbi:hypothetical protein KP509_11G038700 [Ceratopteris richardii]|uniref:Ribosome biogenesis protein WDR12 homolog n=1 Tax=Ceratopteris richardii TaxID=49495 RepID=A0A8T2TNZ3_CERRI|nr:hypothetical protein KP509_11G038700 [Ceratopteris richardii]
MPTGSHSVIFSFDIMNYFFFFFGFLNVNSFNSGFVVISVDGEKWNLISGSKDHTVRVWQLSQTSSKDAANSELSLSQPVKVLKGHTSSVQCVTSDRSGTAVCSGSWDCSIKLWNVSERENEEGPAIQTKRRKLNASTEVQELEVCATITLEGHKQCVSAVSWGERGSVVSASWDHSIRSWDVETSINTETLVGAKALHCLSVGGENMSLFAAGGADPVLRIWDPRMPGTNTPIFQLSSHNAWISACKWHSSSSHHIFSASYDGSIKLWDLRSKIPLLTIDAHKGKVLSADWWNKDSIVSGGTDSLLQIFSGFHRS